MSMTQPNHGDQAVPSNAEVSALLREIAQLLKLEGSDRFRQQAYARAADIVAQQPRPVAGLTSVDEVLRLPGIQEPIAERIVEYALHGSIGYLDHLRRLFPIEMRRLLCVPGLSAVTAQQLHRELGIASLRGLELALREGRVRALLGEAAEAQIRHGLSRIEHPSDRVPLGQILAPIRQIVERLAVLPGVQRFEVAGSARRWEETVGDLNFAAASNDPASVLDAFVRMPLVDRVIAREADRAVVNLAFGLKAEVRVCRPETFGALLLLATGSKPHLRRLQEHARAQGLAFSADGLVQLSDGKTLPCADERQVYEALGMITPPPEMRVGLDEIAWAMAGGVPPVLRPEDMQGDLHVHGAWDDGGGTLNDIAEAARANNYRYVAVTTHASMCGTRHGTGHFPQEIDLGRLQRQFALIDLFNAMHTDVRILKGVEVEIGPGGELQWRPECGRLADVVIGSISSRDQLDGADYTARLLRAMQSGQIDVVAHPTGRLLNQRTAAGLDWQALLPVAHAQRVAWEINAHWRRLDLSDALARQLAKTGALFCLGSDAHHPSQFNGMTFGLAIARRAFLPIDQVLNTWPLARLTDWLAERRSHAA